MRLDESPLVLRRVLHDLCRVVLRQRHDLGVVAQHGEHLRGPHALLLDHLGHHSLAVDPVLEQREFDVHVEGFCFGEVAVVAYTPDQFLCPCGA